MANHLFDHSCVLGVGNIPAETTEVGNDSGTHFSTVPNEFKCVMH